MKVLLIRMWEILRKFGGDRPLSLEDIRQILIEDDRARGISDADNYDKYNVRLLRSNLKAINSALGLVPSDCNVAVSPERETLLKRKQKRNALRAKSEHGVYERSECAPIEKITVGKGESKECLYYNSDAFTLNEVGFLYDAVLSQDCLPTEQANDIIRKLTKLTGEPKCERWQKRVVQRPTTCLTVSNTFDVIHKIEQAIKNKKKLRFKYMKGVYDPRGWMWEPGMWRQQKADPIALYYKDGHYYLYCYDYIQEWMTRYGDKPELGYVERYRSLQIDRMAQVQVTDEPSAHAEDREKFFKMWEGCNGRPAAFQVWTGETITKVTLHIPYRLMQDAYDKFGTEIKFRQSEKRGWFWFESEVGDLYGLIKWALGYGGDVEIISPASVLLLAEKNRKALAPHNTD